MAGRRPVAAGNWKMNTTVDEGVALAIAIEAELGSSSAAEVVLFPPYTHLSRLADTLRDTAIGLGAQNLFWEEKGAFTGEVSAAMIRNVARYVIIGHSERRQYFGETDETVNRRLKSALAAGLTPVVCVGESLAEREADQVEAVLGCQVRGALDGVQFGSGLILAYEPVWAIGTGRAADGEQANAAMGFIRSEVAALAGDAVAQAVRILYGGSVTENNIDEFAAQPEIDGGLVGGASLQAASFIAIVRSIGAVAG
jgi:triosephosphate isomerase